MGNFTGGGSTISSQTVNVTIESNVLQTATVTLTDDQIKALPSGDFEIIPSVGTGKLLVPTAAVFSGNFAVAYTNVTTAAELIPWFRIGTNPFAPYDFTGALVGGGVLSVLLPLIPRTASLSPALLPESPVAGVAPANLTGVVSGADANLSAANVAAPVAVGLAANDALDLHCDNGGLGNFTGGDPANKLKITIAYLVLDV